MDDHEVTAEKQERNRRLFGRMIWLLFRGRQPGMLGTLMRCERCDQGDRIAVRRAKLAERAARVAVVVDVPMEECPACGDRWLDFDTARRLDEMLAGMLASDAEIVTRHFDTHRQTAA